jgi:hypothetical protein
LELDAYRNEIKDKLLEYQQFVIDLWNDMLKEMAIDRPNCEEILVNRLDICLIAEDLGNKNEFEKLLSPNDLYLKNVLESFMQICLFICK